MANDIGGISLHVLDLGRGVGGIGVHVLELQKSVAGLSVHLLVPAYEVGATGGARTFPLPNATTAWQSQAGKRKFPMPGEQVI